MSRPVGERRVPLVRQILVVVLAFFAGQLVAVRLLPESLGFWPHVLIFVIVYALAYVALWRLTEGLGSDSRDRRR